MADLGTGALGPHRPLLPSRPITDPWFALTPRKRTRKRNMIRPATGRCIDQFEGVGRFDGRRSNFDHWSILSHLVHILHANFSFKIYLKKLEIFVHKFFL